MAAVCNSGSVGRPWVSRHILGQQTLGMAMLYAARLRTLGHVLQATEKAMARLPMAADGAVARQWEWEAQNPEN